MGYPKSELVGGTPLLRLDGRTPAPPETEQQSDHLLRSRWYASCIHTGGLFAQGKIVQLQNWVLKIKEVIQQ